MQRVCEQMRAPKLSDLVDIVDPKLESQIQASYEDFVDGMLMPRDEVKMSMLFYAAGYEAARHSPCGEVKK